MRTFKRSLLLCSSKYSLQRSFKDILENISDEVCLLQSSSLMNPIMKKARVQMFRLPYKIRNTFDEAYLKKSNKELLKKIVEINPDFVLVYNSELLLPSTCIQIKKMAKLAFFLGDSPFFTPQNNYFLSILHYADLILVPDSFWVQQLKTIGYHNIYYFIPSINSDDYRVLNNDEKARYDHVSDTEIIYSGMCYVDSWGYKKALLMSRFTDFNFHLYGNKHWNKWFPFFPELKSIFHKSDYISTPLLNAMLNKTKLMPVDGNPGILNGMHLRVFEAISSGVLPLIEYRKDVVEEIFSGIDIQLPIIYSYDKATLLAEKFLSNEKLRSETVKEMIDHVQKKYCSDRNSDRILESLRNSKS